MGFSGDDCGAKSGGLKLQCIAIAIFSGIELKCTVKYSVVCEQCTVLFRCHLFIRPCELQGEAHVESIRVSLCVWL